MVNGDPGFGNVRWRFVKGSFGRFGPEGSFVRTCVEGRDVPTYALSRHPKNWGFVLQSCW